MVCCVLGVLVTENLMGTRKKRDGFYLLRPVWWNFAFGCVRSVFYYRKFDVCSRKKKKKKAKKRKDGFFAYHKLCFGSFAYWRFGRLWWEKIDWFCLSMLFWWFFSTFSFGCFRLLKLWSPKKEEMEEINSGFCLLRFIWWIYACIVAFWCSGFWKEVGMDFDELLDALPSFGCFT